MDITKSVMRGRKLYHLTHQDNIDHILETGVIYSTTHLVDNSDTVGEDFLEKRRVGLQTVNFDGVEIVIRDQDPLNPNLMPKALDGSCSKEDFIRLVNNRVFFWPNKSRLRNHYNRYIKEEPKIFVFDLADIYNLNSKRIELSKFNSGALRCHPHYDGAPSPRGLNTFQSPEDFDGNYSKVVEFTILEYCTLPKDFMIMDHPDDESNAQSINI